MAKGQAAQLTSLLGDIENPQFAYLEYTVLSSAVTKVRAPKGWSVADFSSGIAALTFPKHYTVFFPFVGNENTTNASSTSRHSFETKTIVVASGTAVINCVDQNNGAIEAPVDGTFRLLYLVGG